MDFDVRVIEAATTPDVLWDPWAVAIQLDLRVVRIGMTDGMVSVALWGPPPVVYLGKSLDLDGQDYWLTFSLLSFLRVGWSSALIKAEAAFLVAPRLMERGAA